MCTIVYLIAPGAEVTVTEKTKVVKKETITMVGEQETRESQASPQFTNPLVPVVEAIEGNTVT